MKKYFYLPLLLLFIYTALTVSATAQTTPPNIIWQKTIGGSKIDVLTAMCVGSDSSIVVCGYSNSPASGNKSAASFGSYDYWIVKMDAGGNIIWNKTYGGKAEDLAAAVITTSDGGYLVGGSSVSALSGSKSSNGFGQSFDYWVLKLDASGNKVWDKTIGGSFTDKLTSLAELPANVFSSGGIYMLGGYSYSKNNALKTKDNLGPENNADFWTVVLNSAGTITSQYVFGAQSHEVLTCIASAGKNGFYAAGYSYSDKLTGGKSQNSFGNNDYWLLRSDTGGRYQYQNTLGSSLSDYLTCMQLLPDTTVVVGGYSNSDPGSSKTGAFYGVTDYWMIKLKRDGSKQFDKTFGSAGGDFMVSIQQTRDKGYILGGYSNSNAGGAKSTNSKGGYDYWLVKTDSLGNKQWDKTIGGSKNDSLKVVYEFAPNDFIVAGSSISPVSGDKTAGVVGGGSNADYWVLRLRVPASFTGKAANNILAKTTTDLSANTYSLEVAPNPVKDILNIKYSAAVNSKADFVVYTSTGKTVLQSALTAGTAQRMHSFNIAHLPAGNYFAVLYIGETKLTKLFTKE